MKLMQRIKQNRNNDYAFKRCVCNLEDIGVFSYSDDNGKPIARLGLYKSTSGASTYNIDLSIEQLEELKRQVNYVSALLERTSHVSA